MLGFTMDGDVQKQHHKQLVANAVADQTVRMALGSASGTRVVILMGGGIGVLASYAVAVYRRVC
jgi:hypothetical protein